MCLWRLLESTGTDVRLFFPPSDGSLPERVRLYGLAGEYSAGPEWSMTLMRSPSERYGVKIYER